MKNGLLGCQRNFFVTVVCIFNLSLVCAYNEQDISQKAVQKALGSLALPTDNSGKVTRSEGVTIVDLSRVNSSSEKPPVSIDALEETLETLEHQMAILTPAIKNLKKQVNEVKQQIQQIVASSRQKIDQLESRVRVAEAKSALLLQSDTKVAENKTQNIVVDDKNVQAPTATSVVMTETVTATVPLMMSE